MKEMREATVEVRTEKTRRGEGVFRGEDIKMKERRQTGTEGAEEADTENTGGMRRKNKGFGEQQLREEKGRGRETQRWMRQGSQRIERGKGFLKCNVQISLVVLSLSNICHNSSL